MKRKNIFKALFGIVLSTSIVTGCYRDKEDLLYGSNCTNTLSQDLNDCADTGVQQGSKFTAVESIINNNCISCHNNGGTSPDLSSKCAIVENWSIIKQECVIEKTMPTSGPLSDADQQIIKDWANTCFKYKD